MCKEWKTSACSILNETYISPHTLLPRLSIHWGKWRGKTVMIIPSQTEFQHGEAIGNWYSLGEGKSIFFKFLITDSLIIFQWNSTYAKIYGQHKLGLRHFFLLKNAFNLYNYVISYFLFSVKTRHVPLLTVVTIVLIVVTHIRIFIYS